jgi:hypothetical protein
VFKVGDKVVYHSVYDNQQEVGWDGDEIGLEGREGVIVTVNSYNYGVWFKGWHRGHSCGMKIDEYGAGYFVDPKYLQPVLTTILELEEML